ncbi:MAG: pentapeptide repeat-containing protein [Salibacteraceae bacterium]
MAKENQTATAEVYLWSMGHYAVEKDFRNQDFTEGFPKGDYEACTFEACNFQETDLSDVNFIECRFLSCDLTNAKILNTGFREVEFEDCKMVGLPFDQSNPFLFALQAHRCQLHLATFYGCNLRQCSFHECTLQEVDFTEANAEGLLLEACDLSRAIFEQTNLQKANLSTAFNYRIDPDQNRLRGATFSADGLPGLLVKYGIVVR